jgi:hypothetical protein
MGEICVGKTLTLVDQIHTRLPPKTRHSLSNDGVFYLKYGRMTFLIPTMIHASPPKPLVGWPPMNIMTAPLTAKVGC